MEQGRIDKKLAKMCKEVSKEKLLLFSVVSVEGERVYCYIIKEETWELSDGI